ncbi:MAG: pseudouridine synthase [Pseudomonadales bacterium]
MQSSNLAVLYEDEHLIAINKPSGLLVHPSWLTPRGTESAAGLIKDYLDGAVVHTVHRLDRATSGVLLCAKDKLSAQLIGQAMFEHRVEKRYLAVVRGYAPEAGEIDHPLKYQHDKIAEPFACDKEAQSAQTRYRRLATVELDIAVGKWPKARYSLVEAMPLTGRKHQIRRHLKHVFCPIVGDTNYGEGRHNRLFREHFDVARLLLHARSLKIEHPHSKQQIEIVAPQEEVVNALFQRFGWPTFNEREDLLQGI